ncbi:universal stress protein [Virgisporangium aliadipatigenens]|uniref:Universal stress protein n=1 Tax=Virgisporangium aliadipatigenens TaxID=741659 RepID=A0A8J4DSF7_9ACTN|nr:universal stress protein [Virgisporangium aliadipatigenens]GIJ48131.1 universal stress protein [Virgisporangium aliadipatigenens]
MGRNEVIVGIDGDKTHRAALYWAADEATRRGVGLRIIHAYLSEWPDTDLALRRAARALEPLAEEVLAAAVNDIHAYTPDLPVTAAVERSGPASALIGAADPGDLLVVGSRHDAAGLTATLLGSTAQQVALHSTTSVAVVRGRDDTVGTDATGPVVVGVDGSAASRTALGVAFEAAAARGARLSIVRAFRPGSPPWPRDVAPSLLRDVTTTRAAHLKELGLAAAAWSEKFPDVGVDMFVLPGYAAEVLDDATGNAQLVVVGSRGHGGFAGLLLGSVGLHLIHHADCPVLIAR